MKFKILLTVFALFLSGCSLFQNKTAPKAWLKRGVQVNLPEATLDTPLQRQQLLTATVKGKSDSLITVLDVSNNQITLAGLSPLGIRLFKVTYSQAKIETEQSIVLPQLPPASQVLADIMLSYWPVSAWQPLLPAGWSLKDEQDKRLLRDEKNQIISEITYQLINNAREPVSIQHHYFEYFISIQNMDN